MLNHWQKSRVAVAAIAQLVGAAYLMLSFYSLYSHQTGVGPAMSAEQFFGLSVGLLFGFLALLASYLLILSLLRAISQRQMLLLCAPGALLSSALFSLSCVS